MSTFGECFYTLLYTWFLCHPDLYYLQIMHIFINFNVYDWNVCCEYFCGDYDYTNHSSLKRKFKILKLFIATTYALVIAFDYITIVENKAWLHASNVCVTSWWAGVRAVKPGLTCFNRNGCVCGIRE